MAVTQQAAGDLPAPTTAEGFAATAAASPPEDRGFTETAVPGLPQGLATAAATSACGWSYFQTDLRPLRMQWNSSAGFCGETSVQMIALARGVWISQRQARLLSNTNNKDLILNSRSVTSANIYPLLRNKLAWNVAPDDYWDDSNQTVTKQYGLRPPASAFLGWVKSKIMAGKPVIVAVRLQDPEPDAWYDHIVPLWGTCTQSTSPSNVLNNATDGFSMTTDLKDETNRSASDPGMYSKWKQCPYSYDSGQVGCIPSDIYDYGLAMGDIKDSTKLTLRTTRLFIDGWSINGFDKDQEPGETSTTTGSTTTAKYTLLLWNLTIGQQYKVHRLSGARTTIPGTKAALSAACGACSTVVFTANATSMTLKETSTLGAFPANSVQYFLTVTYP